MARVERHLVRCAGCGRNFDTELYGELSCPYCRAKVWIEPPEGYIPPADPVETTQEQDADPAFDIGPQEPLAPGVGAPGSTGEKQSGQDHRDGAAVPDSADQKRLDDLHRLLESALRAREESSKRPPPWEKGKGGLLTRFTSTIKSILSAPSLFFASLPDSGYARAFLFGWIVCSVGVAFFCLYGLWQIDMNYQANLEMLKANGELSKMGISPKDLLDSIKQLLAIGLVASPVLGAVNLLFTALLNHLGIVLVAGRGRRMKMTLRATSYGFTPLLMMGVPVIGNLLGGIWAVVLQIIALSRVHDLSTSRASLAVLLPLFTALMLFMAVLP